MSGANPSGDSRSRRAIEIPSLDGLRAVSIAIVFAAHVGYSEIIPGGLGVTVFFVLSGYLITTLLRMEWSSTGAVSIKAFYLRRAFRILPLFYVVLALAVAWQIAAGRDVDGIPLLAQAGHSWNYFYVLYDGTQEAIQGTGVYWSLAVEEHFYLLFPLAFILMTRRGMPFARQGRLLAVVCGLVLLWRCVLVFGFDVSEARIDVTTDARADALLFGCIAALVANPVIDRKQDDRAPSGWLAVAGLAAILVSLVIRHPDFRDTLRFTIQPLATVFVLRYIVAAPRSWAVRPLNTRPIVALGVLSYALYLVHHVVITELARYVDSRLVLTAVAVPISVGLAWALQEFVGEPATRLRHRIQARMRAAQVVSVNEPVVAASS